MTRLISMRVAPHEWALFQEGAVVFIDGEYFRIVAVNRDELLVVIAEDYLPFNESSNVWELTPDGFVFGRANPNDDD